MEHSSRVPFSDDKCSLKPEQITEKLKWLLKQSISQSIYSGLKTVVWFWCNQIIDQIIEFLEMKVPGTLGGKGVGCIFHDPNLLLNIKTFFMENTKHIHSTWTSVLTWFWDKLTTRKAGMPGPAQPRTETDISTPGQSSQWLAAVWHQSRTHNSGTDWWREPSENQSGSLSLKTGSLGQWTSGVLVCSKLLSAKRVQVLPSTNADKKLGIWLMPARKKSPRKTGQDGAKAKAAVETLRMALPPKSTLFLPNLDEYKEE